MTETINVGMADYKITYSPTSLAVVGLGSCIAVCIYDLHRNIGGLAHIMLPTAQGTLRGERKKYADSAIELMLEELYKQGARREHLLAKIAGGAQMFAFSGASSVLNIGVRNIEVVEQELKRHHIPLKAKDVGGRFGRTVNFDVASGTLRVRTVNQGEKVI
ncbi:MAG TPA: chemotaxis protein CheD [Desulfobacteria bacterium]|nr:chemotaxis protein CheD [Desulfobacteria bacterium]